MKPDPRAGLPLFQESESDPFWMVVGCILVNRASWRVAMNVHAELKAKWPTAQALVAVGDVPIADLARLLRPLGFCTTRHVTLYRFAKHWAEHGIPKSADALSGYPGCGPYARDSWAIFVEGRRDVEPADDRLRHFLARTGSVSPRAVTSDP